MSAPLSASRRLYVFFSDFHSVEANSSGCTTKHHHDHDRQMREIQKMTFVCCLPCCFCHRHCDVWTDGVMMRISFCVFSLLKAKLMRWSAEKLAFKFNLSYWCCNFLENKSWSNSSYIWQPPHYDNQQVQFVGKIGKFENNSLKMKIIKNQQNHFELLQEQRQALSVISISFVRNFHD